MPRLIGFCGSRSLSAAWRPLVRVVVFSAMTQDGCSLLAGAAPGADRFVLSAAVELARRSGSPPGLRVFACGGRRGGFPGPGSRAFAFGALPPPWLVAAVDVGASVRWWAGGPPSVPIRGRLAGRSRALVRALAAQPGAALVGFVGRPCPVGLLPAPRWSSSGSGTWSSLALAAALGVAVFVFWCSPGPVALPSAFGSWALCEQVGPFAGSWALSPVASQGSLF